MVDWMCFWGWKLVKGKGWYQVKKKCQLHQKKKKKTISLSQFTSYNIYRLDAISLSDEGYGLIWNHNLIYFKREKDMCSLKRAILKGN